MLFTPSGRSTSLRSYQRRCCSPNGLSFQRIHPALLRDPPATAGLSYARSGSTCLKNRSLSRRSTTVYHKPIVFSTPFGEKELFVASVRLQRKMRRTRRIPAKMSPSNTSQNRKQHSEKETFAAFFDKTGAGEIVPYAFRMLSGIFVPIPRQDACRDIDIAPGRRYNILWCFS